MRKPGLLDLAAVATFAVALLHVGLAFAPELSRALGAPEAILADPWRLAAASLVAVAVFAVFGLYALSGSARLWRLPGTPGVLVVIAGVFGLRGLLLFPEAATAAGVSAWHEPVSAVGLVASGVALAIGVLFAAGVATMKARG